MFTENYKFIFSVILLILHQLTRCACREPPIVNIPDQGDIMGVFLKQYRTQTIIGYMGIPYAQPPVGLNRFSKPVVESLPSWEGVRDGSHVPALCWSETRKPVKQHDEAFAKLLGINLKPKNNSIFNEDCLFLNIFVPEDPPPKDGYAVIVWLHSGDFNTGNLFAMNPFQLVFKQKVIVVTVAFRLGIFGFFTSMDGEAPGNYGLQDQAAALHWIKENIKNFEGNPESITLMGHGSGAVSASLHLTSGPWSESVFNRAIIMSGTSLSPTAVRDPKSYKASIDLIANTFGCFRRPTSRLIECLRYTKADLLMKGSMVFDWGPVIDEGLSNTTIAFVPGDPRMLLENRDMSVKKPVMLGYTDMEDVLDVSMGQMLEEGLNEEMYETLTNDIILNELSQIDTNNETMCGNTQPILEALDFVYKPFPPVSDPELLRRKYIGFSTEREYAAPTFAMAAELSKNAEVFMYRFDIKPQTSAAMENLPAWTGVPHNFDLIFIWGMPYWVTLENQTQWDTSDKRASDIIMTMWANFAKFSNPTELGVYIHWTNFTETNQRALIIDRSFNMSDSGTLNYHSIQFWNDYYPKVVQFSLQCCNATSSAIRIHNKIYENFKHNLFENNVNYVQIILFQLFPLIFSYIFTSRH